MTRFVAETRARRYDQKFTKTTSSHTLSMAFYRDKEPRSGKAGRGAAPAEASAEQGQCRVLSIHEWIIWWKWAMAAVSSSKGIAVISS